MNVFGTLPVPTNWPEQDVKVMDEQISATINRVQYRDLEGGIRQMLVAVPQLAGRRHSRGDRDRRSHAAGHRICRSIRVSISFPRERRAICRSTWPTVP